jgi:hypothetical protein
MTSLGLQSLQSPQKLIEKSFLFQIKKSTNGIVIIKMQAKANKAERHFLFDFVKKQKYAIKKIARIINGPRTAPTTLGITEVS